MKRTFIVLLLTLSILSAGAQGFPIVTKTGGPTSIYVDSNDYWLVNRTAQLLQEDIERVSGAKPAILHTLPDNAVDNLIIIGSMDSSAVIRRLLRQNKLAKLTGKWEAYSITPLSKPTPNIAHALVITGSDRRGTAYAALEISREIGVSPWYYWADVPTAHQDELYFTRGSILFKGPAVRYRGFFINDEAPALSGWVHATFGNFNHLFYEKVFELLLRLRGNYLWPAMWGNAFNDDDTLSPKLADQYGIVMGTSHHEPMLRAQQEWKRYGHGAWDYTQNAAVLDSFWAKGIRHMDHHESIVTVGMRGDGDKPMTEGSNIALLEKIVADQRAIIQKVTGKPASRTPQSWALYKEVQDYYDKGMRVPDDVTLLLCDDNWGDVRKLPTLGSKPRPGGYGMYYHFDYVGGPRNYKWINTNQLSRIWEEMHLTREYGDDRIWIVNVGDIKPMEFPTQFFLDYAWDPDALPAERLPEYTWRWAAEQFGASHAAAIADILSKYTKYNARRKPELLSPDTYNLLNYQEAEKIRDDYKTLAQRAEYVGRLLPMDYRDAYFELVLYPVLASANLNELYFTVAKNRLYAAQGRALANRLALVADSLFNRDSLLSLGFNHDIAGGKWPHMMDQTHIGYTYWQEPRHNNKPKTDTIDFASVTGPAWGISVEGSSGWWPHELSPAALPEFNPYDCQDHFIDVFSRRSTPITCTVIPGAPWIDVHTADIPGSFQQRWWISIDWSKVPAGQHEGVLTVKGPDGSPITATVLLDNPNPVPPLAYKGFIETNGCVAIEANNFTKAVNTPGITWTVIPDLGRTGSAVEASPVTAAAQTPGARSPQLQYPVWLFDTGTVAVQAWCSPIIAFNGKPIRYAVGFDDETPQLIDVTSGNEARGVWDKMVADNIKIAVSRHQVTRSGAHILKFYLVDPGVVLQRLVIDAGGAKPSYLGPPESPRRGLRDIYHDFFPIGVAVSPRSISGPDSMLILRQFNSLTPENAMKMGPIHPEENRYNWTDADAIVDFAQRHGLLVRGHNLCWHQQTPAWMFKDANGGAVSKDVLLQRLKDHITTVVSRYKGKVYAWDVVNEAIDDDSTKLLRNSEWYRICGEDFIIRAFEYAHAADPSAQLFYNDYNTERPEKRERVYRLLKQLVDAGVPIAGVGLQAHWSVNEPSAHDLQTAIDRFSSLGLKVQVTELDISIYPWEKFRRARKPGEEDVYTPELEKRQAAQYKMTFGILRAHAAGIPVTIHGDGTASADGPPARHGPVNGVTFWNVSDRNTWLDMYPVAGRKNYPLLFDINGLSKKAWWDVIDF
jgi:GH35 family endo-1,4-beta-xylanase